MQHPRGNRQANKDKTALKAERMQRAQAETALALRRTEAVKAAVINDVPQHGDGRQHNRQRAHLKQRFIHDPGGQRRNRDDR